MCRAADTFFISGRFTVKTIPFVVSLSKYERFSPFEQAQGERVGGILHDSI